MARRHISLRITGKSDDQIRSLAEEYGIPYAVVARVIMATGFDHYFEIRRNLEHIRKAQ